MLAQVSNDLINYTIMFFHASIDIPVIVETAHARWPFRMCLLST